MRWVQPAGLWAKQLTPESPLSKQAPRLLLAALQEVVMGMCSNGTQRPLQPEESKNLAMPVGFEAQSSFPAN